MSNQQTSTTFDDAATDDTDAVHAAGGEHVKDVSAANSEAIGDWLPVDPIAGRPAYRMKGHNITFVDPRDDHAERILKRTVRYSAGGGIKEQNWKSHTKTVAEMLRLFVAHPVGRKDGFSITQGSLKRPPDLKEEFGVRRTAENAEANHIVMLDFDSGASPDVLIAKLVERDLFGIIYSTFSHGKTETLIRVDQLEDTTFDAVFVYLDEVKGYHASILDTLELLPERRMEKDKEGKEHENLVVSHTPMPKYRLVLVLKEPFDFGEGEEHAERVALWSKKYSAVADSFGTPWDAQCIDPTRLMYTARKPKGSTAAHFCTIVNGDVLNLEDYAVLDDGAEDARRDGGATGEKKTRSKANGHGHAGKHKQPLGKDESQSYQIEGLKDRLHTIWSHFNAGAFALKYGANARPSKNGVEFDCPDSGEHTDAAARGPKNRKGFAVDWKKTIRKTGPSINCRHSCTQRHSGWKFVDLILVEHRNRRKKEGEELTDAQLVAMLDEFYDKPDDTVDPKTGRERLYLNVTAATNFVLGDDDDRPLPTERNLMIALKRLGVRIRHDEFRRFDVIEGFTGFDPVLKDQTLTALRLKIAREFQLKIGKDAFQDFILTFATHDAFHPVRDYLDEVEAQWDGVPRIETMLSRYFGSEDTPLSRAMSKCHMIAAARRMRKPGTKHDVALILESEQGWGKSTGIEALASKPFFSDALPVGADSKETIERTSGIWIVELPELAGMEKRAVETVKAALSRNVDIARAAYGKIPERVPRAFVFWGSTNSEKYLRDATGNRRFWGVKCLRPVDVDAIRRDRDQLWAEAAMLESQGVSHVLDPALWGAAGIEQTARTVDNQFVDRLEAVLPEGDYSISKVAVYELLGVTSVNGHDGVRVGVEKAMKMLGFSPSKRVSTEDSKKLRGFRRGEPNGRVVTTRWSSEDHKTKPHMDYFDKTDEDDTEVGPA